MCVRHVCRGCTAQCVVSEPTGGEEDFFMGEAHRGGDGAPAWTSVQECHPTAGCQSTNRKGERLEDELSIMWSRSGASRGKGLQNKE